MLNGIFKKENITVISKQLYKKMKNTLISVIVPVYNAELYIEQCLNSIIKQSYKTIELILIDDGSTDNSLKILRKYEENDERITLITKANQGLVSAWSDGLAVSTGEYIVFVDSDDWIDENMFLKFIENNSEKHDLIVSNYIYIDKDGKSIYHNENFNGIYYKNSLESEIIPRLINDGNKFGRVMGLSRWAKFIKADLIKKQLKYAQRSITYGDDVNIIVPIVIEANSILFINDHLYYYRKNEMSIMNSYKKNMLVQIRILDSTLRQISLDYSKLELDNQIENNLVSMLIATFRNEFQNRNNESQIKEFRFFCDGEVVKNSITNNSLKKISFTDRLILYLIKVNNRHLYRMFLFFARIFKLKS